MLKVWTGTCWSWIKVHTLSRDLPNGYTMQSPALVRRGKQWWLHTPIEKTFTAPPKIAEQVTSTATKICAVDLNINEHIAVCTVQTVEGTIIATRFIGGGGGVGGIWKKNIGRIAPTPTPTCLTSQKKKNKDHLSRKIRP